MTLVKTEGLWKKYCKVFKQHMPNNLFKTIFQVNLLTFFGLMICYTSANAQSNIVGSRQPVLSRAPTSFVSITFDDGYQSIYNNAIPILNRLKLPSTLYIITKYLTTPDPDYMNLAELQLLHKNGHEIGSHTRNHVPLNTATPETVEHELSASRNDLLSAGFDATSFAYPGGYYGGWITKFVQHAGYTSARTTDFGYESNIPNAYSLKTMLITSTTKSIDIKRVIDTAIRRHQWLILVYHGIEKTVLATPGKVNYTVTKDNFAKIAKYLKERNIRVVTVSNGMKFRDALGVTFTKHP